MELEELVERMQRWGEINLNNKLKELRQYGEGEPSEYDSAEEIINSIRRTIEGAKSRGRDISEKEIGLEELEEKARERDKNKK